MADNYEVKNGDCIASIACAFDMPWEEIWNHPNNAELKQKRANPSLLKAGDLLFIPDYKPTVYRLATGQRHRIVCQRPRAKLRLRIVVDPGPPPPSGTASESPTGETRTVVDNDPESEPTARKDEPRKALPYKLYVGDLVIEGKTDDDGYVECEVPANAGHGRLLLAPGTPDETEIKVNLGHLDPIDELSGVKQRLRNLCFDCGDQSDERTPAFEAALRAFQRKHGMEPTGILDDATRARILKEHGT
jgi:N-acetylmuramoyl-L-alanine amidase